VTRTTCDNLTDFTHRKTCDESRRTARCDHRRYIRIGLASATAAACEGARRRDRLQQPRSCARRGRPAADATEGQVVDVRSEHAVRELFDRLGAFDHLVYTQARPLALQELQTLRLERAREFFEIRYFGALAAVKHASSTIRPGGSIVLSSGSAGARPQKG